MAYGKDHARSVNKSDIIVIRKNGSNEEIKMPLATLFTAIMKIIPNQSDVVPDNVFDDGEGNYIPRSLPSFESNAEAISGGLTADMWYKTAEGAIRMVV